MRLEAYLVSGLWGMVLGLSTQVTAAPVVVFEGEPAHPAVQGQIEHYLREQCTKTPRIVVTQDADLGGNNFDVVFTGSRSSDALDDVRGRGTLGALITQSSSGRGNQGPQPSSPIVKVVDAELPEELCKANERILALSCANYDLRVSDWKASTNQARARIGKSLPSTVTMTVEPGKPFEFALGDYTVLVEVRGRDAKVSILAPRAKNLLDISKSCRLTRT